MYENNSVDIELVSVIMPVYNVRQYLREAIDSVITQTYQALDIIIIDDGSYDGSGDICDTYANKDDRITVIHQNNFGLSFARNVGLNLAKGEIIAFLDSDDAYDPDFVNTMVSALKSNEADIVVCEYSNHKTDDVMTRSFGSKSRMLNSKKNGYLYDHHGALQALASNELDNHVWNKIYRCSLWSVERFPVGHVYEDIDTTYRIFNNCKKVLLIHDSLYMHRIRKGSIESTFSMKNIEDRILAHEHFEKFVTDNIQSVFSYSQLDHIRIESFYRLVTCYAQFSWSVKNNEEYHYSQELRRKTILLGRSINDKNIRRSFSLFCLCYCPNMIKMIYTAYHSIRSLVIGYRSRIKEFLWL